ncbi:MFS transporter [Oleidesulfovibrio sp.]|uniref:MFS transporter n=1 Tax=Oleidesulfovibrio sp. TaxID=2909707 RepID=UPI003A85A93C
MSGDTPAVAGAEHSAVDNRRMLIFLVILALCSAFAFQGWRTLLNNYAVEVAGLSGLQMGLVQSLREVPGFLALGVVFLLLFIREHKLAAFSIVILGCGVILTGQFPSFAGVAATTMLMSFGFHYYETLNQSLILQYFGKGEAPVIMGRIRGFTAGANLAVGGSIALLSLWLSYSSLFILVGGVAVCGGIWALGQNPSSPSAPRQNKGIVLRSRYWLFYLLTFLSGARRQIFVAFAVFLMVDKFGFGITEVTLLFIANNVVNWFLSPAIGRAVNRYGERSMLTVEYVALVFVFLGYAVAQTKWQVAALYIADHVFYNFALAIKSYFQKIADPADIAPSMAASFTINHIGAVILPALGGYLWMIDYRIPFVGAAALACVSLLMSQFIPLTMRKAE